MALASKPKPKPKKTNTNPKDVEILEVKQVEHVKTSKPRQKWTAPAVGFDFNQRVCVAFFNDDSVVKFLRFQVSRVVDVEETSLIAFDREFTVMDGYPVTKAAQIIKKHAIIAGCTSEAREALADLIPNTPMEAEMAEKKTNPKPNAKPAAKAAPAKPEPKKAVKPEPKAAPAKAAKPEPKAAPAKPEPKKAAPAKAEKGDKAPRVSAGARFKELIMQGKLTDEQIFATVQKEFGLDDSKRTYVAWYRNDLKKKGENPPAPKKA